MPIPLRRRRLAARAAVVALIAATTVLVQGPTAHAAAPGAPSRLRVEDVADPVGTGSTPYFGWLVNDTDANEVQTKYQIVVSSTQAKADAAEGDVWDSGQVSSDTQNHVAYGGSTALTSNTKYFWRVRTWDKDANVSSWSSTGTFVVGLLANSDWSGAKWIKRDTTDADDYTYFRKSTAVSDKTVKRATVFVSSAHKYELYLNGTLVGKGPSYHYPQYQYYNAYDITSKVTKNASNTFAVLNHWFGSGQGRPGAARGLIVKAVIQYSDDTTTVVGTDGTWKVKQADSWVTGQSQRNSEGIGYVEKIDASKLTPAWNTTGFTDSGWSAATEIGAHPTSPWTGALSPDLSRIVETEVAPASITSLGSGKYVVDLGKVYAGVPRIDFSGGTSGTTITMRGGYRLTSKGEVNTSVSGSTDMSFSAVDSGSAFTFRPLEYLGMRYFQVDNSPMAITTSNFTFVVRHSALDASASSFTSSDATLNNVWDLLKHSASLGANEQFNDPQREKGGFLLDAAVVSLAAMPAYDERVLTRKSLHEFLQSMDQFWSSTADKGRMNAVYPNNDGGRDIPDFTQAYLVWAWQYYLETGDKKFLSDNYAKLKSIADYVTRSRNSTTGLIHNLVGGGSSYQYGIIDWPSQMRYGYDMTDSRTVINAYAYTDFDIVSKIAGVLGNSTDQTTYRSRADDIKTAINTRLLNGSGVYVDGVNSSYVQSTHVSQQANSLPLAMGITPADKRASVVAEIKKQKMHSGMVTVLWLARALGEAGEGRHLRDLYTRTSWEGWAKILDKGATATWESWDADTADGTLSHPWGAAGLDGLVRYVLGVQPLTAQYAKAQIKPLSFDTVGTPLKNAGGKIATERGSLGVTWDRNDSRYLLTATVPVNMKAKVYVPKGGVAGTTVKVDGTDVTATADGDYLYVDNVGSGTHTFERAVVPAGKYDFGSAGAEAGYTQVPKTAAYSSALGYGWDSTTGLDERDRTAPDALKRDFVFGTAPFTFKQDLPDGDYSVRVVVGDASAAQVAMDVSAEGTVKIDDLTTTTGTFADRTFTTTVDDGQLNLTFDGVGDTATARVNALVITPANVKKYDMGSAGAESGYTQVPKSAAYTTSAGYGWDSTTGLDERDRTAPDALKRDFVFSTGAFTFKQDLANGDYRVRVVVGDNSAAQVPMDVSAEGITKIRGLTTTTGGFADLTFTVTVSDGQLNLTFDGQGATATARVNAVEIGR